MRRSVAKNLSYGPESGGVPPEMFNGDVDEDGWVEWKIIPSTLSETDIVAFFNGYGITPPQTLVEYMKADFHLIDQVLSEKMDISLPEIASDNPFKKMKMMLEAWDFLVKAGYIPIAEMGDGWGPICYKQSNGSVVWFDHDELPSLYAPPKPSILTKFVKSLFKVQDTPITAESLEKPLYNSLDEFYEDALKVG
jgi:hypothetical protein